MRMHEAGEVIEAHTAEAADRLLADDWTLIAVVSGERYDNGQKGLGPIYILAKPRPKTGTGLYGQQV